MNLDPLGEGDQTHVSESPISLESPDSDSSSPAPNTEAVTRKGSLRNTKTATRSDAEVFTRRDSFRSITTYEAGRTFPMPSSSTAVSGRTSICDSQLSNGTAPADNLTITNGSTTSAGTTTSAGKLSTLHGWLSEENRRVRSWWAARSGTDLHRLYVAQLHDTDELRSQLNEQLRALDCRVEAQVSLLTEMQDFMRRRAEVHQDYASKLDKMAKTIQAKHKDQKVKREQWELSSAYSCWMVLLQQTRRDARDQAAMAEVYHSNIVPRFTQIQEDVHRIYKRCREIAYESHEELLKVLHELHTSLRTYHTYQAEHKAAQAKLASFQEQKAKLQAAVPKEKLDKSKKYRVIEKEIQKRNNKFLDAKLKALKARNEYLLCMESANSAIHKYFVEDLSDIIDAMDFGLHNSLARALLTHQSGQECFKRSLQTSIDDLQKTITNLDSRLDKQKFLKYNNAAFMLPKKFEFQGHKGDEVCQVQVTREVQEEIEKRHAHLVSRLTGLRAESEENWKTIETAEKTLLEMLNRRDYDVAHFFSDEAVKNASEMRVPEAGSMKLRADHQETEAFYLNKFREYTLSSNLICRLQSRYELLRRALGDDHASSASPTPARALAADKPKRRRIGRTPLMGQPKLFGGSLEEYLEATHQDIPLILRSCIRVINLYGLHHQGIFRVSGSQLEINNFRESFEKLEDPLADVSDASDMNSVAGVLKLYFRELREPLFPTVFFDQFMEIAQLACKQEFVSKIREVVITLPRPVFVVMRYLFAFLNHLSEFSDENMMDPYNLAICFGPTLVPIPEDKDQVQFQNLVNELIKNIIIFSEDIFPADGGPTYEKYLSQDSLELEADVGDAPNQDDFDSEHTASEDEGEVLEAVAQFDFVARSERELSFSKGDLLVLHAQVSSDWWKGAHRGKVGLIPDKYILLKIREDDKDRPSDLPAIGHHHHQLQRRPSSSSDSLTSSSLPAPETPSSPCGPSYHSSFHSVLYTPTECGGHQQQQSPHTSCLAPNMTGGLQAVTPTHGKAPPLNGSSLHSASQDSGVSGVTERSHSPLCRAASPAPGLHTSTTILTYTPPQHLASTPLLHSTPSQHLASTPLLHSTPPQHLNSTPPLVHSVSLPRSSPSSQQSGASPLAQPREEQEVVAVRANYSSPPLHQSTLPRMHISLSQEGQLEDTSQNMSVTTIGRDAGVGAEVTIAHNNMVSMRHHSSCTNIPETTKMVERSSAPAGGGSMVVATGGDVGSTIVAIETSVHRRPSHSSLSSSSSDERLNCSSHRTFREVRTKMKAVGAPDLVMDLPVSSLSSSPRDQSSSTSPQSSASPSPRARSTSPQYVEVCGADGSTASPSPDMTAAECFAKQNQSTLKKTPVTKTQTVFLSAGGSSDAQTQTLLQAKSSLGAIKASSIDVSELKITESDDFKPTSIVHQRSMDVTSRSSESPLVEVRSAAPPHPVTPNTPRLAARYLQAVAAASGGSPVVASVVGTKPHVRVKPTVLKKPSLTEADAERSLTASSASD
ncbi:SLIT-ROBO Rho GTPase-activating protein 1 isoform X3 [Hyalella azteca]|uniref:SLIT-ROBO Rho GTPase-activating protein 1 isoform X3 n=1 Tax=Hyalella azteca TaxID=294128 RepID=A0A979FFX2_HYAAZ|nr:SLIT-ROBO Rho GTPase-activating protein 1 isoform X3 [Hyalella azteca]